MGDRGIPKTWRHMNGYSSHTYMWVNADGERFWVKYHFKTNQGIECLTQADADRIAGEDGGNVSGDAGTLGPARIRMICSLFGSAHSRGILPSFSLVWVGGGGTGRGWRRRRRRGCRRGRRGSGGGAEVDRRGGVQADAGVAVLVVVVVEERRRRTRGRRRSSRTGRGTPGST